MFEDWHPILESDKLLSSMVNYHFLYIWIHIMTENRKCATISRKSYYFPAFRLVAGVSGVVITLALIVMVRVM